MSETVQLWVFGGMLAAIVGLGGILWRHMVTCSKDISIPLTELATQMKQVNIFIAELREMKHLRIDPYLPHAFNDLHERVARLEKK